MPHDAPAIKLAATRGYGAEVVLYDRVEQKREAIAKQLADERGLTLVPPFDHPHIIAGQGTTALELLTDVPDLDVLIVPIGGGGLISGCCIAAHALKPEIRIFGVEPDTANDTFLSLQNGADYVDTAIAFDHGWTAAHRAGRIDVLDHASSIWRRWRW